MNLDTDEDIAGPGQADIDSGLGKRAASVWTALSRFKS